MTHIRDGAAQAWLGLGVVGAGSSDANRGAADSSRTCRVRVLSIGNFCLKFVNFVGARCLGEGMGE